MKPISSNEVTDKCARGCVQCETRKEPFIKDVRKIFGIFDPPVRISRNLSVLFVRKIVKFLEPPPHLRADVICTWSLVPYALPFVDAESGPHWIRIRNGQGTFRFGLGN